MALDHPLERAGAVHRVVAELAELVARGVGELDGDPALGDPRDQPADLDVDDVAQLLLGQRVELDDVVEAVDELGLERRLGAGRGRPGMFEVMISTALRKSTVRPWPSVRRPSSITCSRMLKTSVWAFSISSSRTTRTGGGAPPR